MASTGSFSRPRIVSPTTLLFGSASLRSKNQVRILRAHLSEDEESLIFKAKKAASLRFIESRQPSMSNFSLLSVRHFVEHFGVHLERLACRAIYSPFVTLDLWSSRTHFVIDFFFFLWLILYEWKRWLYADPLFVDQYAGCLVSPQLKIQQFSHHYCVATKFIDDKLLQIVHHVNGLEQVLASN